MTDLDSDFLARSRAAFSRADGLTLSAVIDAAEADETLPPVLKRDLVSALRRLVALAGEDPGIVEATPSRVRNIFARLTPAAIGMQPKTLANIRALVSDALRRYGAVGAPVTKRFPPSPRWRALLDQLPVPHRASLNRLAAFASVMRIEPEDVSVPTLSGLQAALESEEVVKHPRKIVRATVAGWNRARRDVPGWPDIVLSTPDQRTPFMVQLASMPPAFIADVEAYRRRMLHPDPLDPEAPPRPLRPATVAHRVVEFRLMASALIASGRATRDDVISLALLLEPENFRAALRVMLERTGKTPRLHNLARGMRLVAKHHSGAGAEALTKMQDTCRRLDPHQPRAMTTRNRGRLEQFDDPGKVAALLRFPEEEAHRADRERNRLRAAKRMECAVAVLLLTRCGLRVGTLRQLPLKSLRLTAGKAYLHVPAELMKSRREADYELNAAGAALIARHLEQHRPVLPGAQGDHLFPGESGGPRSKNAMYDLVTKGVRRGAGLVMNPHLFRHAIAKIAVEADPGAYLVVSRVLGHASLDTTMGSYLGTEGRAAARHLDALLQQACGKVEGRS